AMSISVLQIKHQQEIERLNLATQPFKTIKLFILAVRRYLSQSVSYLWSHGGGWIILSSSIITVFGILLATIDGPHEKHVEEVTRYIEFGLWWMALGIASSIGLGSGLHTFVLYLGPHIALFTLKATQCGRVDIKSTPYDTIQLNRGPSWLGKDCADFGDPIFPLSRGVPLSSILPQIQLEAILWGLGTAIGELPPYFISRAARLSGDTMEELDASPAEDGGFVSIRIYRIKRWLLMHAQYLNFFSILLLASIPNPLFDLAGIMSGQFGVGFWEFFLATLIGKAFIKTHIQTLFIISVCNNQLLNWMENELVWVVSFIPGSDSVIPNIVNKLNSVKDKFLTAR
ncbi:hypothetical protein M569_12063, partial [Genlisea aurea]